MPYDVKHDGGNNHGVLKHSSVSWRVRVGGSGQAVAGDVDRMFGVTLYRVAAPQPATARQSQPGPESHFRDQSWEERRQNSEHGEDGL